MVEAIEEAQKALRTMDYDSASDDGDDEEHGNWTEKSRVVDESHPTAKLPPPEVSSESASSLERFLSSTDPVGKTRFERAKDDNVNIQSDTKPTVKASPIQSFEVETNRVVPSGAVSTSQSLSKLFNEVPVQNALIDDDDSTTFSVELQTFNTDGNENETIVGNNSSPSALSNNKYPGTAGFLEMEEEPLRNQNSNRNSNHVHKNNIFGSESIKTDSGLVLTHRKTNNALPNRNKQSNQSAFRDAQQDYFEAENGVFRDSNKGNPNLPYRREGSSYFAGSSGGILGGGNGKHSMVMVQVRRLMSYVKIWVVIFLIVAVVTTGVFLHSIGHEEAVTKTDIMSSQQTASIDSTANGNAIAFDARPDQILLLPLTDGSEMQQQIQQNSMQVHQNQPRRLQALRHTHNNANIATNNINNSATGHHLLQNLRQEFETWIQHHGKAYHSHDEKEHRFSIWAQNHQRTAEKNAKHGPCTLTKQHVFGSNQFKDLAPEEFQSKFLTGYKGAFADVLEKKQQELPAATRQMRKDSGIGMVLDPKIHKIDIHESVAQKQRHLQMMNNQYKPQIVGSGSNHCEWYDLSCLLRYVWLSTGISFGSLIGTMEPKFDADAFPNSVDWRDSGAVTSVRTQGDCGACWAVTAVETVESAHFISTGNLYTLSETEIIVCDDSCEMCSGGWPQNAYEWVMDHGGLPLSSTLPYDSYTLLSLTAGLEGESYYYTEESVESYRGEVCPADGDQHSGSGSGDNYWEDGMENGNYADYSSQGRYGNIKGYGYATDRCLCYTDGSGCNCDDQDEDRAVGNIATYGPAAVCLEASTWQDYNGGIMTSDIGCGQEFLDMNHCVQVVGYAFTTGSNCNGSEDDCNGDDNKSGSNSKSGSDDSGDREGYWIVRNQWGESWGMNGYAYVAMGANTCGILNDMTVAYA